MLHADKSDAAGAYDGEITGRAGLWLVGPDLSPILCDGGCIFLRLTGRASAGHMNLPEIPDPAGSALVCSFFFMVILPGFNLCDYRPISGRLQVCLSVLQVLKTLSEYLYTLL